MGLDDFNLDEGDDGDTYYLFEMVGVADVEIINHFKELPRPIRKLFEDKRESWEAPITMTIEFKVEGRGWSKDEAWTAAHSKIKSVEDNELDDLQYEVMSAGIKPGSDSVEEKEL
jgi:hypothetical protein